MIERHGLSHSVARSFDDSGPGDPVGSHLSRSTTTNCDPGPGGVSAEMTSNMATTLATSLIYVPYRTTMRNLVVF